MSAFLSSFRRLAPIAGLLTLAAAAGGGNPGQRPLPRTTVSYDLYIGFAAQKDCVPAQGPYLTKLTHDIHVPGLRFVFETRKLGGITANWFPLLGGGPPPSIPRLVFDTAGQMRAALCPHIKCPDGIKKAWFTRQEPQFDAWFTAVPVEEIPEIRGEIINIKVDRNLETAVPEIVPPFVLNVHFVCAKKFAWTGDCIVRHQDCGSTVDLQFYLALPAEKLLKGEEVRLEFPFQTDDFDAPGTLTVRFFPPGSIKRP